jgi:hypothetical protein
MEPSIRVSTKTIELSHYQCSANPNLLEEAAMTPMSLKIFNAK